MSVGRASPGLSHTTGSQRGRPDGSHHRDAGDASSLPPDGDERPRVEVYLLHHGPAQVHYEAGPGGQRESLRQRSSWVERCVPPPYSSPEGAPGHSHDRLHQEMSSVGSQTTDNGQHGTPTPLATTSRHWIFVNLINCIVPDFSQYIWIILN